MPEHRIEVSNPFFQSMITVTLLAGLDFHWDMGPKHGTGMWDWTGLTKLL